MTASKLSCLKFRFSLCKWVEELKYDYTFRTSENWFKSFGLYIKFDANVNYFKVIVEKPKKNTKFLFVRCGILSWPHQFYHSDPLQRSPDFINFPLSFLVGKRNTRFAVMLSMSMNMNTYGQLVFERNSTLEKTFACWTGFIHNSHSRERSHHGFCRFGQNTHTK